MKKMTNIAWGVIFLLVGFTGKAAEEVQIEILKDETLVVQLKAAAKGTVLRLQDEKGVILFKDSLFTNKPYRTSLHLKLLPEGAYFLNVEEDLSIRSWTVDKAKGNIELRKEVPVTVYKPHFQLKEDRVRVFMINPRETKTSLSVYDSKGEVVGLSDDKKTSFRRVLDFSRMPQGLYRIHVRSEDKSFYKTIRIEPRQDPNRISMVVGNGF